MNLATDISYEPLMVPHPVWMPEVLSDELRAKGRLEFKGTFSRADRKIMRKRKKIRVSRWAERHRVVTMSSLPGAWRNRVTPYLPGIMDASFFPCVQTIIICKAPQTGVSEAVNNCIGYAVDRQPGPVLCNYPDRKTARENSFDRIQPMILSSRRLKSYTTGNADDLSGERINLQHMPIYMAWSRSAATLANKPIRYVVNDETDKYPETAGKKETDPISLAEKRTVTYRWSRKIWKISTPTIEDGPIWQALNNEAQVVFDFWVKCPACGEYQVMVFEQIKWPEDERDPEHMVSRQLAWYECVHCGDQWDDSRRDKAVRGGEWRSREKDRRSEDQKIRRSEDREDADGQPSDPLTFSPSLPLDAYLEEFRPLKIGFHLPSWLSYFVSLSEPAAAFLKGQKSKTKLKDFRNGHQALPWIHYEVLRQEDAILALRDDRPRGRVPGGGVVAGLVAGVDTQDDGFWYRIRAFGFGGPALVKESWGVREGFVTTFEALEQILWQDKYMDEDGNVYVIRLVIQDALGHRTSEVYTFCIKHRGRIIPSFGRQKMAQSHTWNNLQYFPGGKKPIPGGLKGINVNTNYYKDELSTLLEISPADPGAWHENTEFSEAYARHMTSEFINDKGVWECPSGKDNHLWDCSVLCLCAHDILGMMFWPVSGGQKSEVSDPQKRGVRNRGINGEKWLERREGFIKR